MPEQCWEVVWGTCRLLRDDLSLFHKDRLLQTIVTTICSRRILLQYPCSLCSLPLVSRSKATPRGLILRESSYLPLPLCCTSLGAWIHSCSSINIKHISLGGGRKLKWQGLWQMLRNVDLFITESQANLLKALFFPSPPLFFNVQTSKQWIVASVTATKPCQLKPVEHSLQW